MTQNLIQSDVKIMRAYYDEALKAQGIPAKYQYPNIVDTNTQGEPVIDSYSIAEDTFIFFEGAPKLKTFKRFGWVVEKNDDLPFLIHCSFNLKHLQKDCIFEIAGQHADLPSRKFRVIELTTDIQCPDHFVAQVIPIYRDGIKAVGRTRKEVEKTYNKSNRFLNTNVDYRGQYISEQKGER